MNLIKQFCQSREISQRELARALRYHPQYISNLGKGRMPITASFVTRVWNVYGSDAANIFFPYVGSVLPEKSNLLPTQ